VLVGRGADLAAATLAVDGAEVAPITAKTNPRQWTVVASPALAPGAHTARVFVRDAAGGVGGFTWQFMVGSPPPPSGAEPAADEG
jgi:hypothetical protein